MEKKGKKGKQRKKKNKGKNRKRSEIKRKSNLHLYIATKRAALKEGHQHPDSFSLWKVFAL